MSDPVKHPSHYTYGGVEVLDVIESWDLQYHLGNAVKYLARAGRKNLDKAAEDIRKCNFYLRRYWEKVRGSNAQSPPWTSQTAYPYEAVVKAWSLDEKRAAILSAIWYGECLLLDSVEALAVDIETRGAKEALCLT